MSACSVLVVTREPVRHAPVVLDIPGELLGRNICRRVAVADRDSADRSRAIVREMRVEDGALARVERDEGSLSVKWGSDENSAACTLYYRLPLRKKTAAGLEYDRIDATCVPSLSSVAGAGGAGQLKEMMSQSNRMTK